MENQSLLIGYSASTRRYFLQIAIGSAVFCLFLLIWMGKPSVVPLLLAIASLTSELWWTTRHPMYLMPNGLLHDTKEIPFSAITRFTKWGPFGIPWTPFKIQGVTLYLNDGTSWCISSKAPAFDPLLRCLDALTYPPPPEPLWYHYPPLVMRAIRYIISFALSLLFLLIVAMDFLLILGGVVLAYFIARSYIQSRRQGAQTLSQDAWIAGSVSLILLCVLYFIFDSPYLLLTIALIPMGIVLWFPWQPSSIALIADAVFVGKKRAYPFRHLRTTITISKFFLFKFCQLSFANGDVLIMPTLENFESFKSKLDAQWGEVQHRYVGKKMSDEEAEIRTPSEEARRIRFFESDQIPLGMPVVSQFLIPLLALLHIVLLVTLIWMVYFTSVGRWSWLGIFLQSITPFFAVIYGGYIIFNFLPRLRYLYSHAHIEEEGIQTSFQRISWDKIHSLVSYQDATEHQRLVMLDSDGRQLFQIRDDIADWEIALDKIKRKVQEVRKSDPIMSGASSLLQNRSKAWRNSQRWLLLLILVLLLPWTIQNISDHHYALTQEIGQPAPLSQGYLAVHYFQYDQDHDPFILSWLFGNRLLVIPYQDYLGQTWYALVVPCIEPNQLQYNNIRIRYLPDNPGYVIPYGDVTDIRLALLAWLESYGFQPENWQVAKTILMDSCYVFWIMAIFLVLLALIRQDLLAGLLMQRMPAPLGPELYLSGTLVLNNTLRLVIHLLVFLLLGWLLGSLYWPDNDVFWLRIPVPGLSLALTLVLPVFLCAYLAFYITVAIPEWWRSLKTWELTPDGITDYHCELKWNEIRSISVFEMPTASRRWLKSPPRRIALIQGENKRIILEGTLIHFDGIVAHIRQQSHVETNSLSKAKYFYRRSYGRRQLIRVLTAMAMFWCLSWSFNFAIQKQNEVTEQGISTHAQVVYTVLDTASIVSYQDQHKQSWYSLVWQHEPTESFAIQYHQEFSAFWQSLDEQKISTAQDMFQNSLGQLADLFDENQKLVDLILVSLWYGVYLLLSLPFLWALIGATLGIPPYEPKPASSQSSNAA